MLRSSQSGRVYQAASPRLTCVEQEILVGQGDPNLQLYCAVGCSSRVASRGCTHLPRTERPCVSQRTCPGRTWNESTRHHHPGPGHALPSLVTGHTGAENRAGRPSASSVGESRRSPVMRAPGCRGCALCVGEGSCFYGLHQNESIHHTTSQAPFLPCRSFPRLPPCSPTPVSPTLPRTASGWNTQATSGSRQRSRLSSKSLEALQGSNGRGQAADHLQNVSCPEFRKLASHSLLSHPAATILQCEAGHQRQKYDSPGSPAGPQ